MFDIPEVAGYVPRRLKPWLFIFFALIIQFSGGVYLAAASDMVGTTGLMREDILMAGYASLCGMAINFAVMFRIKFRFSSRSQLLWCGIVLISAGAICATTESVPLLVGTCFVAGWFRMQGTFCCNSTIQLWLTPKRDMAIFFCYVYLVVDGAIQLSGIASVYSAFSGMWQQMNMIMCLALAVMMILTLILVRPYRFPHYIPLLGIDWIGALLWSGFMLSFTYVCVYGDFHDWWESTEICMGTAVGAVCLGLNLWRATFLRHPYVSWAALKNCNVVRATVIYIVFFTLLATEHVMEHGYAETILGFDSTNMIDLNLYVLAGIVAGCGSTYYTFALSRWRYKTMVSIGFALAAVYLGWFYFCLDYGVEKESLLLPLFMRGAASVIVSIVLLTSIVQSGLPFETFPQALTLNGFSGAVLGATFGPALVGEWLQHTVAANYSLLGSPLDGANADVVASVMTGGSGAVSKIAEDVGRQALAVSMKEIYGWLLMVALASLLILLISYAPVRPKAIFPKWRSIRRSIRQGLRLGMR